MQDTEHSIERMGSEIRHSISEDQLSTLIIIGICTGGVWVAERLKHNLGIVQDIGILNIAFYRDDFSRIGAHPQITPSKLPMDIEDRHILLVDDVLYTGRTVRAALNEIFDYGRPASVRLAVLIDRGERELPVQADFIGEKLALKSGEHISISDAGKLMLEITKVQ